MLIINIRKIIFSFVYNFAAKLFTDKFPIFFVNMYFSLKHEPNEQWLQTDSSITYLTQQSPNTRDNVYMHRDTWLDSWHRFLDREKAKGETGKHARNLSISVSDRLRLLAHSFFLQYLINKRSSFPIGRIWVRRTFNRDE